MKNATQAKGCLYCSASLPPPPNKKFCNSSCRGAFNNRRMSRGAIVYDLAMAWRKERKPEGLANLCHQLGIFIQDDNEKGIKSYNDYPQGIAWNIPIRGMKATSVIIDDPIIREQKSHETNN